jgi:hypothetical protein
MNVVRAAEYKHIIEALRDPQRRSWIMLNPTSIGDTAIVCALSHAFVKQHGHAITMVVPEDHLAVTQMFPNRFLRVLTVDRPTMMHIINHYLEPDRFELDVPFCAHPYDLGDGRSDELMYLYKYPGRGGLNVTDMYRYLLRLPWSAQLERPQIPAEWDREARQLADSVGMKMNQSVTLFPANSSAHPQFPDLFWQTLAARLAERGLKVFTNMKGGNFRPKTMPVAGTTPIELPMHLSLSLVRHAGRTISGAHGMQFLQFLGGRFKQMTVAMPIAKQFTDFSMNSRVYHPSAFMAQFMYPELCLGLPFAEFSVPFDGSDEDLKSAAVAIADESFDDAGCYKRPGSGTQPYLEEHAGWLSELIQPLPIGL